MNLKDFVSETLSQIIDGVKLAQDHAKDAGAVVSPTDLMSPNPDATSLLSGPNAKPVQLIYFDVAVSTAHDKKAKGGAGLFVGPVTLGGQAQSGAASSTVNRIKFSVPIILPGQ